MKAKRYITEIISLLFISATLSTLSDYTTTPGELSNLDTCTIDSSDATVIQFIDNKTSILTRFGSDCKKGCRDEAQAITDHLYEPGDVHIIFVSLQGVDKITPFDNCFRHSEKPNIIVGQDYSHTVPAHPKNHTTPLMSLADKNLHLREVITGETGITVPIGYMNEIHQA